MDSTLDQQDSKVAAPPANAPAAPAAKVHSGPPTAAATAGLNADIMAAVADGRRPDRMAEDETVVYDFSLELQNNQSVSDATYAKAVAKFGEPGVVELASIQGYYAYLAMVMNVARITAQPNALSRLERYPQLGK